MTEVTYTVADGIAHIELNRPESANTIDMPLAVALGEAATNAAEDDAVRAVVLSGAGARFCGGGDVAAFAGEEEPSGYVRELAQTADSAVQTLESMAKPVVAAVQGAVAGGGLGIMLAADVIIAAEGTKFVFAYPNIGLSPDCGASGSLPRVLGQQRALAFALLGAPMSTAQALEQGLVTEVAADPGVRAREIAGMWVAGASEAYGRARSLIRASADLIREEVGQDEANMISWLSMNPETRERFTQFLSR
ncbi:enoyl-CoA hydratase/isomerase family protein [Janibacter cremeus]|uniref:enoyl-CoA hydratase/isomerase family protein n=1 Tax=Janibacter cremeus TaxID=1285192 RepID=UPI0023F8B2FB|nr:enoyl-CoA hydratase/isomerase family protein [Janibacter cremeus]WEV77501.1 enoyl-CoA hydratase/isomerase family protein [Janibacter cremeus]